MRKGAAGGGEAAKESESKKEGATKDKGARLIILMKFLRCIIKALEYRAEKQDTN